MNWIQKFSSQSISPQSVQVLELLSFEESVNLGDLISILDIKLLDLRLIRQELEFIDIPLIEKLVVNPPAMVSGIRSRFTPEIRYKITEEGKRVYKIITLKTSRKEENK